MKKDMTKEELWESQYISDSSFDLLSAHKFSLDEWQEKAFRYHHAHDAAMRILNHEAENK